MNNQVKQKIDKEAFVNFLKSEINNWNGSDMYARVRVDTLQWVIDRIENNNAQVGLIDTPPVPTIKPGDKVHHIKYFAHTKDGIGVVQKMVSDDECLVTFFCSNRIVPLNELEVVE